MVAELIVKRYGLSIDFTEFDEEIELIELELNSDEEFIEKAIEIINNKRKEYIMSVAEIVYTKTGETFDDEHFISEEKLNL